MASTTADRTHDCLSTLAFAAVGDKLDLNDVGLEKAWQQSLGGEPVLLKTRRAKSWIIMLYPKTKTETGQFDDSVRNEIPDCLGLWQ